LFKMINITYYVGVIKKLQKYRRIFTKFRHFIMMANRIEYNAAEGRLQGAALKPVDGKEMPVRKGIL
jgi:hypothetical protein